MNNDHRAESFQFLYLILSQVIFYVLSRYMLTYASNNETGDFKNKNRV